MQSYSRIRVNLFLNFFPVLESLAISLPGRQTLLAHFELFRVKRSEISVPPRFLRPRSLCHSSRTFTFSFGSVRQSRSLPRSDPQRTESKPSASQLPLLQMSERTNMKIAAINFVFIKQSRSGLTSSA